LGWIASPLAVTTFPCSPAPLRIALFPRFPTPEQDGGASQLLHLLRRRVGGAPPGGRPGRSPHPLPHPPDGRVRAPHRPLHRHRRAPHFHALPLAGAASLHLLHCPHPRPLPLPYRPRLCHHHRLPAPRPFRVTAGRSRGSRLHLPARQPAHHGGVRDLLPQLLHLPRQARAVRGGHLRARPLAPPRARPDGAVCRRRQGGRARDGAGGVVRARLEPKRHQFLRGDGRRRAPAVAHLPAHRPCA
jgi:hypothetical protein